MAEIDGNGAKLNFSVCMEIVWFEIESIKGSSFKPALA
jgi:hypothetical protein